MARVFFYVRQILTLKTELNVKNIFNVKNGGGRIPLILQAEYARIFNVKKGL